MSEEDYNRDDAPIFLTEDDTPDANVFSQNCLKIPGSKLGELVVLGSKVSRADSLSGFRLYKRVAINGTTRLFLGSRVDTGNNNDGYYGGIHTQAGQQKLGIFKRESGVLTQLVIGPELGGIGWVIDTEVILEFNVNGSNLRVELLQTDRTIISSISVSDTTFSNSGTGNILKVQVDGATKHIFIDKHFITNAV